MSSVALDKFKDIPNQMLWREGGLRQIEQFRSFAEALGFPWDVVGHHTSKSIKLPVIRITCGSLNIYLRDNFHDINVCVVGDAKQPITIPMSVLFDGILPTLTWDWYLDQVSKCRNYSWREWTDEQMNTPGLLALSDDAPSYAVKEIGVKARWVRRMTDPAWFGDWSRGQILWDGEFGPGVTLRIQDHPFLEGISELIPLKGVYKPYKPGCHSFALALYDMEQATNLIKRLSDWGAQGCGPLP